MLQITPIPTVNQLQIIHNVFGLGTFPDTHEIVPHTDSYEEMIQWLRNRVSWLASAIVANNPDILQHLTMIDVAACNEELNAGSLTLCGITITVSNTNL